MKKFAPLVAILVLACALAVVIYYATRPSKTPDPPANGSVAEKNEDFKVEDFMLHFDLDSDGKVTPDEFNERYGKGEPPLYFHERDGAPALSAADAFRRWDRNRNGTVDAVDIKSLGDKAWENRAREAEARGLHTVSWNGVEMNLNPAQKATFEAETGALARGEVPFAGAYWDTLYLKGPWTRVREGNTEVFGYAAERNGRIFVLTEKAELLVKDPAKVELTQMPDDDPHMQYAYEIQRITFDMPAKNLELAQRCVKWGMKVEAGMLYARVLIFQRDNQEALDALGFKLEGEHFKEK
jgi:hypothetical protein